MKKYLLDVVDQEASLTNTSLICLTVLELIVSKRKIDNLSKLEQNLATGLSALYKDRDGAFDLCTYETSDYRQYTRPKFNVLGLDTALLLPGCFDTGTEAAEILA